MVLTRYGLERFLYRLAQSQYRDQFILKGALLFELWTHRPYRSTRDLDLEGQGEDSITRIKRLFIEIMGQAVEDDGLIFDPQSLRVARIKEEQEYEGLHFEGGLLTEAIKSTFDRRGTEAPAGTPLGL